MFFPNRGTELEMRVETFWIKLFTFYCYFFHLERGVADCTLNTWFLGFRVPFRQSLFTNIPCIHLSSLPNTQQRIQSSQRHTIQAQQTARWLAKPLLAIHQWLPQASINRPVLWKKRTLNSSTVQLWRHSWVQNLTLKTLIKKVCHPFMDTF